MENENYVEIDAMDSLAEDFENYESSKKILYKKTITKNEYLQLIGLKTLAVKHNKILEDIQESMEKITGESEWGHTADTVWTKEKSIDELLENLNIEVEDGN